jgi:hypothetical protein
MSKTAAADHNQAEQVATARPWTLDGAWIYATTNEGNGGIAIARTSGPDQLANAALIVTAVNERPALIAERDALRLALERVMWNFKLLLEGKPAREVPEALAEAAAALAAGGGK